MEKNLDWLGLLEQETLRWSGYWRAGTFLAVLPDSMANSTFPRWLYGLRYDTGMFKQSIKDCLQQDRSGRLGAGAPSLSEICGSDSVEVWLNCSFKVLAESCTPRWESPPACLHIKPRDLPISVWRPNHQFTSPWALLCDYFRLFHEFQHGISVARWRITGRRNVTRVLYPNDSTRPGTAMRSCMRNFPCRMLALPVLWRVVRRGQALIGPRFSDTVANPAQRYLRTMGC